MSEKEIRISQCMIVKNEEKNIRKALSWGREIVSEQIVVDTGSTDRTVEIAEEMGAVVCHFTWIDDFSAAKNYAIDQAQYEWIAFLDADEYFPEEDVRKIPSCIREIHHTECNGIATGWLHVKKNGEVFSHDTQIRIFRNLPGLRYRRRIHEYLTLDGKPVMVDLKINDLRIYHTGYVEEALQEKTASGRNLTLIQAELADRPDDYEMWGYLGNEYGPEEFDKAEEAYRKAIALMPEKLVEGFDTMAGYIYERLLQVLVQQSGRDADIREVYQQAVRHVPEEADYDYVVGNYYASQKDYRLAEEHLRRCLGLLEKYGNTLRSTVTSGRIRAVCELLSMCCYNNNNLADCIRFTTILLKEDSYLMTTLVLMISAFGKDEKTTALGRDGAVQVAAFLGRTFYDFGSLKDRLFVLRAAMAAGYQQLTEVLRELFTPEELAAVEKTLGTSAAVPEGNAAAGKPVTASEEKASTGSAAGKPAAVPEEHEAAGKSSETDQTAVESVKEKSSPARKHRIVLFYSEVESFNYFTDRLSEELQLRGHETFIFDLRNPPAEDPHSCACFNRFTENRVDAAICFDALGLREDLFPGIVDVWDQHQAVVADIYMDAPPRFFPAFKNPPRNYQMFCCDRDHVEYIKRYYGDTVKHVDFMPHVGVTPKKDAKIVPYADRKYDILFCGTYYRPQDKFADLRRNIDQAFPGDDSLYQFYELMYEKMINDSSLSVYQAVLTTAAAVGWSVPDDFMEVVMYLADSVDWAIRMYYRERVVSVLSEAGLELHLLGRGWENHPSAGLPNVHHIDDRIPYGETLAYMADARINLNVMPWFKSGTHDRIFNTLLQRSVPLTDSSGWIDENFTDGVDIAIYDLKHLEELPDIAGRLLKDTAKAEAIIQNGCEKAQGFTWSDYADWFLAAMKEMHAG